MTRISENHIKRLDEAAQEYGASKHIPLSEVRRGEIRNDYKAYLKALKNRIEFLEAKAGL